MLTGCTPWPEAAAASYRAKGYWQGQTIPAVFDQLADAHPDRVIVCDIERRVTARELVERSRLLAAHFHRFGLARDDRVVFQLPNSAAFFEVFLALLRIGVIPIMALPPHRETELLHFARFGSAKALFVPQKIGEFDFRPMAEQVRAAAPTLQHVFVQGEALAGQQSLTALANQPAQAADLDAVAGIAVAADEIALMLLSGGTTALPKLIPRTHNDYVYNFRQSGRVGGFSEKTVLLAILPLAHNYTLGSPGALGAIAWGGRVVLSSRTDINTVFSLVERERVTVIPAAVPLIVNWLNDERLAGFDVSSLELVQNGGARLSPELRSRLRQRLGCQFQEVYGTAEGLLNMTRLDDPDDKILDGSGAPICPDDEIKVLGQDDKEVPDGELGELVVRGPYTIRGYYNAPENNAKAFTSDGFYRMGDIVRKNGRYVTAEGRKNDLINRGGEKISIDEVENYMLKHPAVHSVAIVAMPDPVFGEKACAFVTLNPGQSLTFEGLKTFLLDQKIAKFKLPERLEVLNEMPISPAGKIMRRTLREIIENRLTQEKKTSA
ncbi:MAG: AMP-binding protein [Zoogloeaceae bacterium]|jgi:2,3-dihydroxybenzoate-AMP ligase|nr:AMP-binding protein [Zoogloeaceae bacterium]